jgi:hypothetical protein
MSETSGTTHYTAREVVGVFPSSAALEAAVDELEQAGVTRSAISVLGADGKRSDRVQRLYESAEQIGDDPAAQQTAFVSSDSETEGKAVAVALPFTVGGFAGAWAVAAAGGALAAAIGATLAGGAAGAAVGVLLLRAVARRHADNIHAQLARGGLVLWVSTPDAVAEQRALDTLRRCGGASVHAHDIVREWGAADRPLSEVQPDPFLERDKAR